LAKDAANEYIRDAFFQLLLKLLMSFPPNEKNEVIIRIGRLTKYIRKIRKRERTKDQKKENMGASGLL